jgi:hypothetical protein
MGRGAAVAAMGETASNKHDVAVPAMARFLTLRPNLEQARCDSDLDINLSPFLHSGHGS